MRVAIGIVLILGGLFLILYTYLNPKSKEQSEDLLMVRAGATIFALTLIGFGAGLLVPLKEKTSQPRHIEYQIVPDTCVIVNPTTGDTTQVITNDTTVKLIVW